MKRFSFSLFGRKSSFLMFSDIWVLKLIVLPWHFHRYLWWVSPFVDCPLVYVTIKNDDCLSITFLHIWPVAFGDRLVGASNLEWNPLKKRNHHRLLIGNWKVCPDDHPEGSNPKFTYARVGLLVLSRTWLFSNRAGGYERGSCWKVSSRFVDKCSVATQCFTVWRSSRSSCPMLSY